MSDEQCVTRRASLKTLGAMGAVMALGGVAAAQKPEPPTPAGAQDKPAPNVVQIAVDRFTKGHA